MMAEDEAALAPLEVTFGQETRLIMWVRKVGTSVKYYMPVIKHKGSRYCCEPGDQGGF